MITFKDFKPTQFDSAGLGADETNENWLVLPVTQTRDSEALDLSNFQAALDMLGGESDTVQIHRFGHWGPGWFEIIIIDPTNAEKLKIAEDIESTLENYPVLDDQDFSEREYNDQLEYIKNSSFSISSESEVNQVWRWCSDKGYIEGAEVHHLDKAIEALGFDSAGKFRDLTEDLSDAEVLQLIADYFTNIAHNTRAQSTYKFGARNYLDIAEKIEALKELI